MNKLYLAIGILLTSFYTSHALAGEWLIGAKAGIVDYDTANSDAGVAGSFMFGKEMWDIGAADIAIEGEIVQSLVDPELGNVDNGFESIGGYISLRTAGPLYVIGRAGLVSAEIGTVDDQDISLGFGVGFSMGGLRWEVEYTTYEVQNTDVDYISLGLSF